MNPANKGRYYHDGRFATLLNVVNHYNIRFSLGLSAQEKLDLVEYLKSLPAQGVTLKWIGPRVSADDASSAANFYPVKLTYPARTP